jgi:hypothetical protein
VRNCVTVLARSLPLDDELPVRTQRCLGLLHVRKLMMVPGGEAPRKPLASAHQERQRRRFRVAAGSGGRLRTTSASPPSGFLSNVQTHRDSNTALTEGPFCLYRTTSTGTGRRSSAS